MRPDGLRLSIAAAGWGWCVLVTAWWALTGTLHPDAPYQVLVPLAAFLFGLAGSTWLLALGRLRPARASVAFIGVAGLFPGFHVLAYVPCAILVFLATLVEDVAPAPAPAAPAGHQKP